MEKYLQQGNTSIACWPERPAFKVIPDDEYCRDDFNYKRDGYSKQELSIVSTLEDTSHMPVLPKAFRGKSCGVMLHIDWRSDAHAAIVYEVYVRNDGRVELVLTAVRPDGPDYSFPEHALKEVYGLEHEEYEDNIMTLYLAFTDGTTSKKGLDEAEGDYEEFMEAGSDYAGWIDYAGHGMVELLEKLPSSRFFSAVFQGLDTTCIEGNKTTAAYQNLIYQEILRQLG